MTSKKQRKILVVDDDETIRCLCEEVLKVPGYLVETARHGIDALKMISASDYDLVVSDVNMPGLDGAGLYLRAVKERPGLRDRFLFMTGGLAGGLDQLNSYMDVKCLAKPFRIADLLARVEDMIFKSIRADGLNEKGRRRDNRLGIAIELGISSGGEEIAARTENISTGGVKALHGGEPLEEGAQISLCIGLIGLVINRKGRVVWSRAQDARVSAAGLYLNEPVPASLIFNMAPVEKAAN